MAEMTIVKVSLLVLNQTIKTTNLRACVSWSFLSERGEAGGGVGGARASGLSLRFISIEFKSD